MRQDLLTRYEYTHGKHADEISGITYNVLHDLEKEWIDYETYGFTIPEILLLYDISQTPVMPGEVPLWPVVNPGFHTAMRKIKGVFATYGVDLDKNHNYVLVRDVVKIRNRDDDTVSFLLQGGYGVGEKSSCIWLKSLKTVNDRQAIAGLRFATDEEGFRECAEDFLRRLVFSHAVFMANATKVMIKDNGVTRLLREYCEQLPSMIETGAIPTRKYCINVYAHAVGFNPFNEADMRELLKHVTTIETSDEFLEHVHMMFRENMAISSQVAVVSDLNRDRDLAEFGEGFYSEAEFLERYTNRLMLMRDARKNGMDERAFDLLQQALEAVPKEYKEGITNKEKLVEQLSAISKGLIPAVDTESIDIFSPVTTFGQLKDNQYEPGVGVLLPDVANKGILKAVITTNEKQDELIKELNSRISRKENKIVYGRSLQEVYENLRNRLGYAPRCNYFVSEDEDIDAFADSNRSIRVVKLSDIARQIISALGRAFGIIEEGIIDQMRDAAIKFAQAA